MGPSSGHWLPLLEFHLEAGNPVTEPGWRTLDLQFYTEVRAQTEDRGGRGDLLVRRPLLHCRTYDLWQEKGLIKVSSINNCTMPRRLIATSPSPRRFFFVCATRGLVHETLGQRL